MNAPFDVELLLKNPEAIRHIILREECEADLIAFVRYFWRVIDPEEPFVMGWTLEAIADHLMAVTDGDIKRLLINVPPGFTKSLMVDCYWPAWEWGPVGRAHLRYISAAYGAHITTKSNRAFMRLILHDSYQRLWGSRFQLEKEGEILITNDKTGFKYATSIAGQITGDRANRFIVDDPNNPKEVESDAKRETANLWVREVVPDRLTNLKTGSIVCIQQRTHDKDVSGTILDILGEEYTHLCIPMEYDPRYHCGTGRGTPLLWEDPRGCYLQEDPTGLVQFEDAPDAKRYSPAVDADGRFRLLTGLMPPGQEPRVIEHSPILRREGMLAWPQRFPREVVDEQKKIKGPFAYSGQYQQNPVPRGGGLIQVQWWQVWGEKQLPDFDCVLTSLDTATKEKEENDWNAATTWGIFTGPGGHPCLMLIYAWRMRTDLATLAKRVGETCHGLLSVGLDTNKKERTITLPPSDYLLIEDKTRGHDLAAEVRRQFSNERWSTHLLQPIGDKVSRVVACQPFWSGRALTHDDITGITVWEGGIIYAPNTDWADLVIRECERFPRGEHDDFVDSATQALLFVRKGGAIVTKREHERIIEDERALKPQSKPIYNA